MAEPIRFQRADGAEYVLEFNRKSIIEAEKAGFSLEDLEKMPMGKLSDLFYFSFLMHHPFMKRSDTDKILFEEFGGLTQKEIGQLSELYAAPYEALINSGDEKNVRTVKIL